MNTIKAFLVEQKEIAEQATEAVFSMEPNSFTFSAGQYVWIELPKLLFPDTKGSRRAFSIASSPNTKGSLRIAFRNSESGYKKTLLSLPIGAEVALSGPYGSSYVPPENPQRMTVYIAGGVGVTPFVGVIQHEKESKSERHIKLFYLNENENRAVYLDELKRIASEHKNFDLRLLFGKDNLAPLWEFIKEHSGGGDIEWYVSGPQGMVTAVGDALSLAKIPENSVHYEENYPLVAQSSLSQFFKNNGGFSTSDLFYRAIAMLPDHMMLTDIDGKIKFANKAAEEMTGYSFEEMKDQTPRLWGGLMGRSFYKNFWRTIKEERKSVSVKVKNHKKNGSLYTVLLRVVPVMSPKGDIIGFMAHEEDITELERLSEAKTEFVSLAAHQLRTPLTGIEWTTERFLREEKLTEAGKQYIEDIHFSTHRLSLLVKQLLDTSRLESGKIGVSLERLDLVEVIETIIKRYRVLYEEKQISLLFTQHPESIMITADRNFLGYVLDNIISNAIEYTPPKGKVEIFLEKKDNSALFSIKDTGIGIPKDEWVRVFKKFGRASNAAVVKTDGTGLGLYIALEAAKTLGGKIWFDSEVGKGSTFFAETPLIVNPNQEKEESVFSSNAVVIDSHIDIINAHALL